MLSARVARQQIEGGPHDPGCRIRMRHSLRASRHLGQLRIPGPQPFAYKLGRSLKWDRIKEEFVGDAEANRLRSRARREPWRI